MKKIALAAAIAALSANASADWVAVKVTTGGNAESYVWDIDSITTVGSYALPTALSTAIAGADSVVWDAFTFIQDETASTVTDVRGFATNTTGANSTLFSGATVSNAISNVFSFATTISQPAFVDGVAGPSVSGDSGFYDSALHGESLAGGVGVFGFDATAALGETVALWEVVKATGCRISCGRGNPEADLLAPTSASTGLNLTLSANGFDVAPVPVPAAVWLMGSALAGLGVVRRRAA